MQSDKRAITKRVADSLKPGETVWDSAVRGFGVRCQRRDKVYVLKYVFRRRQRWISIGKHGSPWTVEQARTEARRLLGVVAADRDPAIEREQARHDITLAELCELYLREGCTTKKRSTIETDKGRIKRHIKPLLGKRYCRDITGADVERMMQDIANGKTATDVKTGARGRAIVKGGTGTAKKAVTLLGAIFAFAVRRGFRADNPVRGVKTFRDKKRERFLSLEEIARLGEALAEAEHEGSNLFAIAAIRALMMTGCRKGEIVALRWREIDFDRSCLRLPDSKTDEKVVPVGEAVLALLRSLPRYSDNEFVFPGKRPGAHFGGLPRIWDRIRCEASLEDVRLHDLRHSFASVAAAEGDSLLVIGKLLGHKRSETTARYAHLADDPLKRAADRISDVISGAMNARRTAAGVIEMPVRRQGTTSRTTEPDVEDAGRT